MISFIIPYMKGRKGLLIENLKSLAQQTDMNFEVILVCQNCDDDHITELSSIDIPFDGTVVQIETKGQNPAKAQNVGVDKAQGDIIVLTSPEVINAKTNVEEMHKITKGSFWVGHVVEEKLEKLPNSYDRNELCLITGMTEGIVAKCTKDDWAPWKYFLGIIHKEDYLKVGGMDEEFMNGIAWEDREFAERVIRKGIKAQLNTKIVGIHLWHPRGYQDNNSELRFKNQELYVRRSNAG